MPSLGGQTPLIGFCGAPWTVASYMVGGGGSPDQRAAKLLAYRDPETFKALLDLLVETSSAYLIGQVKAGVRALQIFDSWAGSLADNDFASLHDRADRGDRAAGEGRASRRSDHRFPPGKLGEFRALCGGDRRRCAWLRYGGAAGSDGLDASAVAGPGQSRSAVAAFWRGCYGAKGESNSIRLSPKPFVFNLGHGILPETPIENVERLIHLVRAEVEVSSELSNP